MRIGLAYNQRPDVAAQSGDDDNPTPLNEPSSTADAYVEWDEAETIAAVETALRAFGEVILLEAVGDFATRLESARVDLLFNMAEGHRGPSREAHVPAIAEFLGVRYTGSDPLTLSLALHKGRTKEILAQRGITTAPFLLIESPADLPRLRDAEFFPAFLKPAWEGSSKGISQSSFAPSPQAASVRARFLLETYRQPVLVEAYLPGDEFTVAVMGNGAQASALPLIRYRFDGLPDGALPVMGYEAKWLWDRRDQPLQVLECPASTSDEVASRVEATALSAYHALGCRDWARVDVRLDQAGVPNVVEINPLPGILPDPADNSCFPRAAATAGMSYEELIQAVVRIAWRRLTGRELPSPTLAGVTS